MSRKSEGCLAESAVFTNVDSVLLKWGYRISREQLLDAVWGHNRAVTDRTVDVYILRLRQKIEVDPANPLLIRSVRGFGYSFSNTTQPSAEQPSAQTAMAQERVVRYICTATGVANQ